MIDNLYEENADIMMAVYNNAKLNYKYGEDTEHNKIIKMAKYSTMNKVLTTAQLGWAKAYARRNNLSSTQSADSSTNSLSHV